MLADFARTCGLTLTKKQLLQLQEYANCVWAKKDFLNLTSAASLDEIFARHICDGLVAAGQMTALNAPADLADMGAGCGYIGMTLAVALPRAHVTLVESIERRCKFMQWAALQAGITNITVKNARLGQGTHFAFDAVTERAMGQLPDIVELCLAAVKPGGTFVAYQGENPQTDILNHAFTVKAYVLPGERKQRHLVLFNKDEK